MPLQHAAFCVQALAGAAPFLPGEKLVRDGIGDVRIAEIKLYRQTEEYRWPACLGRPRVPGEWYVACRNHVPLLYALVPGSADSPDAILLANFQLRVGSRRKAINTAAFIRMLAGDASLDRKDVLAWAVAHLDGQAICGEDSPLRVVSDDGWPLVARRIKPVDWTEEPEHCVGWYKL